jgi:hypothetical protein
VEKFADPVWKFTDSRALIQSGEVDAVLIATPHVDHTPSGIAALAAGLHVLVEKPSAQTPGQARELIEIAARHDRILQVGHLERFNAAILALGDTLGKPRRLFPDDAYVSIDLQQKVLTVVRKPPEGSGAALGQVAIEERTYEQGLRTPAQETFDIVFDPADTSHRLLETLAASGEKVSWYAGFSDGTKK